MVSLAEWPWPFLEYWLRGKKQALGGVYAAYGGIFYVMAPFGHGRRMVLTGTNGDLIGALVVAAGNCIIIYMPGK